jgi:hypothetical protein
MAKQIFNQSGSNLNPFTPQLQSQGWLNGNILTSLDQNTALYIAYNFSGLYQQINNQNSTNVTIPNPSANIYCYQFVRLTNPNGTAVTINLGASTPYMDEGMEITIWNNSPVLSTVRSNINGSIIYPIQPNESIRLKVISTNTLSGFFLILNDTESLSICKIGSFQDALFNNDTIDGYFERGWLLYGSLTIGSASSGGDYADDRLFTLFSIIYNNCPSAIVSGGRSGDPSNDWFANKTIQMQYIPGAVLGQYDNVTQNFKKPGNTFGDFTHSLTEDENGEHNHLSNVSGKRGGLSNTPNSGAGALNQGNAESPAITSTSGLGSPHNNTQPTLAVGRFIRGF